MDDRNAYLEALGLTPWVLRERGATDAPPPAPAPDETAPSPAPSGKAHRRGDAAVPRARVRIGPGNGSCLYLCGASDDEAAALASDLARVPCDAPVWAKIDDGDGGTLLEAAIAERLFTQVVVFGEAAARLVFGEGVPDACGPARVTVVDDLARLARDAGSRRACWAALKTAGVARAT